MDKGTPLFDYKPSAKVEPFPFHLCKPKVRHAAALVVENGGERGAAYLRMIEEGIRRHLAAGGFGPKAIEKQIVAFRQAVGDECIRLLYGRIVVVPENGGAA